MRADKNEAKVSDITAKIISIDPADEVDVIKKPVTEISASEQILDANLPASGWIWGFTIIASLLWLGVITMAAWMTFGSFTALSSLSALQWAGLAAITIMPIALIVIMGFALRRLTTIAAQSMRLTRAADVISRPDAALEARAKSLAGAVRSQVLAVNSGLETSLERLAGMETVLRGHVDALANSHIAATRQTGEITSRLSEERDGLRSVSESFDERMNALSRMMSEHSERLSQSTHIAEQKIQEARVSVEGAAAKINASSEIVRENALAASEKLQASQSNIAKLGEDIQSQSSQLDELNTRHAEDMGALILQLRDEQEQMNAMIEARLDKMRDMSLSAKLSAQSLTEASDAGRQTIEALAQSASLADSAVKARFVEMEDMVRYSNSRAESISDRAAKRVRDSLALTRMEIGRIEEDMRELESRITEGSLNIDRRGSEARDVTPKPKWRKSLLKFRPLNDDEPSEPQTEPRDDAAESIHITPVIEPVVPIIEPSADDTTQIPALSFGKSHADLAKDTQAPLDYTLDADPKIEMDIPDPNADIDSVAESLTLDKQPLSLSRPASPVLRQRKKAKGGWRWRDLLGSINKGDMAPAPGSTDKPKLALTDEAIIESLSTIGLSPMAVVDEGCIIEAVNARKAKGAAHMRAIIETRLPGPIGHLKAKMAADLEFKQQIESFAQRYYQTLIDIEANREAMRERLESEAGRAFMLADAALG